MMSLSLGTSLSSMARGSSDQSPITAMFMGQSEIEYLFDSGTFYRTIAQPTPGNGNLIVFTQGDIGAAPVRTEVNPTTVAAGQVNPAMAFLSAFLDHAHPGRTFVIGDGAHPGTNRPSLADDGNAGRNWSDFAAVASAIESEFGSVQHLIECWYNSDAQYIGNFKQNFWPMYFGIEEDGTTFTLGSDHDYFRVGNPTAEPFPVDHCLWDANAASDAKGRGLFTKAGTKWHILTPMPFNNAPTDTEADNFSAYNGRLSEPDRQVMIDLASEPEAQAVGLVVGPSAHMTDFSLDSIHPNVNDPDGQILMASPFGVAVSRAAGRTIGEPVISGIEGPDDGSYADLVVDLPNGGTLSTLWRHRMETVAMPADDVAALLFDESLTGCPLTDAELKVPGTDTLPASWVWDGGNRRVTLQGGQTGEDLDGWDFSNCGIIIAANATAGDITRCKISENVSDNLTAMIDVYEGASRGAIKYCTFTRNSLSSVISHAIHDRGRVLDGTPIYTTGAGDVTWNEFLGFGGDTIKTHAPAHTIGANYFDVPASLESEPTLWDNSTTYATGGLVYVQGSIKHAFRSLQDGNLNNQPPASSENSTAFWQGIDNHGDTINVSATPDGVIRTRNNYFNYDDATKRGTLGAPWTITSGIRAFRDELAMRWDGVDIQGDVFSVGADFQLARVAFLDPFTTDTPWAASIFTNVTYGATISAFIDAAEVAVNDVTNNTSGYTSPTTDPRTLSPHEQGVTGIEIDRGGARRPVFALTETTYPQNYRGTVHISDTGSGSPKKGRLRVTPETPFAFGNGLSLLRGQANAATFLPRDYGLYDDFPIEHIPALYDPDATYPFEGVAVRPYQEELTVPVSAPAFTARGATFDGATLFYKNSAGVTTGQLGLISVWMRNTQTGWTTGGNSRFITQMRFTGGGIVSLRTFGTDQMVLRITRSGGTTERTFRVSADGTSPFVVGQWYHLVVTYDTESDLAVYVNGTEVVTAAVGGALTSPIAQVLLGCDISGADAKCWLGDMAYFWYDPNSTLDMSVPANMAKFRNGNDPVDLGANGETPTGSSPAFFFDGDAPSWGNQGSAGSISLFKGALTASPVPSLA